MLFEKKESVQCLRILLLPFHIRESEYGLIDVKNESYLMMFFPLPSVSGIRA